MNRKNLGEKKGMKSGWIAATCAGSLLVGASTLANVQADAQSPELAAVQQELVNAREAVEEARKVAERIVLDAQREAALIRQSGAANQQVPVDLEPIEIQNGKVAVELAAGTVEEIATAIMPGNWRVMVDVKDQGILQRRFQFVSTKSRDQALRDLLQPVGLQHQYFFDLKDSSGARSPLLVISKR